VEQAAAAIATVLAATPSIDSRTAAKGARREQERQRITAEQARQEEGQRRAAAGKARLEEENRNRKADGTRLATASLDKTAKVWDATSGQELLTLKGHNTGVSSVAWSPDAR